MLIDEQSSATVPPGFNWPRDSSKGSMDKSTQLPDTFDARVHSSSSLIGDEIMSFQLRLHGRFLVALVGHAFSNASSLDTALELTPESLVRIFSWSTARPEKTNGAHLSETTEAIYVHRLELLSKAQPGIVNGIVPHGAPGEKLKSPVDPGTQLNERLDNRLLDARVNATKSIFKLSSGVHEAAVEYFSTRSFFFVPTPTLINYEFPGEEHLQFSLPYFHDKPAWLTQTGELHLGMALAADLERVYDLHTVFRREEDVDARHLVEFTMLEAVFNLQHDWTEILDLAEGLIIFLVQSLQDQEKYVTHTRAARRLYPRAGTLKLGLNAEGQLLRITFREAKRVLREILRLPSDDHADLTSAEEAALGKYFSSEESTFGEPTDVFVIVKFPRHLRAFSIRPCTPNESESFDIILRGQEVVTGCRLLHNLTELRAAMESREHPIDPECPGWRPYVQAHEIGMPPWGGFGMGINRFVQGLVGLNDIRETVLFPRDAIRLSP